MDIILATKSTTPIIGQLASLMGYIMDGIYRALNGLFGIQNLGLCIIIFSIIIYLLMTPLQIRQQKFSKMSAIMQPEIQAIQKKYQGKRDQESMQRMNEETQMVYQKYGVSATGSCVQLLIQFPILMALWQVIYRIPAYVQSVKDILTGLVTNITGIEGYTELVKTFIADNKMNRVALVMNDAGTATSNSIVDFLYALSPAQWEKLAEVKEFAGFTDTIKSTASAIRPMQNFLGLNIAEQPLTYITAVLKGGSIVLAIIALLIPLLSWLTQVLNIKLMPQAENQNNNNGDPNAMASSMKTMNTVMPLMSAVFCFTFPVGLGIYWIASAVVRSVQQVLINRHFDKIDMNELIQQNVKKMEEKRAKAGLPPQKITNQAHQRTKNLEARDITSKASSAKSPDTVITKGSGNLSEETRAKKVEQAYENARNAAPGSITAKANMVRDYNERNKKK